MANNPYDFVDKYNTKLSDAEEFKFKNAMASYQLEKEAREQKENPNYTDTRSLEEFIRDETRDYDMRGAFQKGIKQGENFHWDDEFKKPNHITFSTDSKYNGVDGYKGGTWTKDDTGAYTFTPPKNSMYSDAEREKYWLEGDEASNGNHLNTAQGTRIVTGGNTDINAGLASYNQSNTDRFISQVNKEAPQIQDIEALAKEHGGLVAYNPTLMDNLRNYWNNTSRQDLLMDNLLSAGSVFVPALAQAKGLQLAKNAPSALASIRNGLVREIGEQAVIDTLEGQAQQIANTGANIDDSVRIIQGLSKLR